MNADQISQTIARALQAAGLDTHGGGLGKVSETIRQALEAAGLAKVYAPSAAPTASPSPSPSPSPAPSRSLTPSCSPSDTSTPSPQSAPTSTVKSLPAAPNGHGPAAPVPAPKVVRPKVPAPAFRAAPAAPPMSPPTAPPIPAPTAANAHPAAHRQAMPQPGGSQFLAMAHSNYRASRAFKLFVPASYAGVPMPLLVMLHGCKQNPDDFAAGTRMNALAEQHGFLVAYPAQTMRDNLANCWNWFERAQQVRGGVEPELIAGIVAQIGIAYAVESSRVFVAGLSAGAAMAVILGATYPEVFAGVAAHSGLPLGAAHDVASAFSAMQGAAAATAAATRQPAVPTLVIYGDADPTVAPGNGAAVVAQSVRAHGRSNTPLQAQPRSSADASVGTAASLRTSTTTDYRDASGRLRVSECVVHGGKHSWFGGSAQGSYTDANGPDASAEIVRFFLQLPAPATAPALAA
jgi:poly(hydroxyalkanoate) depolymerase family esterase